MRTYYHMKALLAVCIGSLVSICAADQKDIDLGGKLMTFTNLQGRIYENVRLERGTLDGVIYSLTNGAGGGMVKYKDLSTNFLSDLNIPADRVQIAQQRDVVRAEQKQRYDAEVRALALKQQQQEELAASNAVAQAQAQAQAKASAQASPDTTGTLPASNPKPHGKKHQVAN